MIAAGVVAAVIAACGPDDAPDDVGDNARAGSPSHQPGQRNRAVPIEALRPLLGDGSTADVHLLAAYAAWSAGAQASALLPLLRTVAEGGEGAQTLMASLAVGRITGDTDEPLLRVRGVLARTEVVGDLLDSDALPLEVWRAIGDLLASAPLTQTDLPLLMSAVTGRSRSAAYAQSTAALRGIERLGATAAPAVPAIRSALGTVPLWWVRDGQIHASYVAWVAAAARALAAIGPAAREAIPDLQRVAAISGDPDGVVRDAIARLR